MPSVGLLLHDVRLPTASKALVSELYQQTEGRDHEGEALLHCFMRYYR